MGHVYLRRVRLDPEGPGDGLFRLARALWAAGLRPGHVLQNCYSYHLTPGAWMTDLPHASLAAR